MGQTDEICSLIRITDKKFAQEFLSGRLRFGLAKKYRLTHDDDLAMRYNKFEMLAESYPVSKIEADGMPEISNFAGRYYAYESYDTELYILCMTSLLRSDFQRTGNFEFDVRLNNLGNVAIFVRQPTEFLRRIEKAFYSSRLYGWHPSSENKIYDLVQYLDIQEHVGRLSPFQKSLSYSFQKEFRVILMPQGDFGDGHYLDIGNIEDICTLVDINDGNESIKIMIVNHGLPF